MKRLLLPLLLSLAIPASARVNPEIHEMCSRVSDYEGCIRANTKKLKIISILFIENLERKKLGLNYVLLRQKDQEGLVNFQIIKSKNLVT